MPRTIKADDFQVFQLDELTLSAREKAIEAIAEKLGGDWWDQADSDDISDDIRYKLASEFGVPGHEKYGEGDFPGITGVTLDGWDLERGGYLALRGTLDRDNAPNLPWQDGVVEVALSSGSSYTTIYVEVDEDEVDLMNLPDLGHNRTDRVGCLENEMEQAISTVINAAIKAGIEAMEYKTSAENAENLIEANGYEFKEDGTPYFG